MRPSTAALALALFAFLSATAASQNSGPPELIPRELAEALLAVGGPGRTPTILVGTLPPTVESKIVLPAGATVVGGMTSSVGSAVGILLLDGPLNSVSQQVHSDLLKAGWEPQESRANMFMATSFIDAPSTQARAMIGNEGSYCGRGGTLGVRFDPRGYSQTRLTVTSMAINQCAQMREMMRGAGMGMERGKARPVLVNPAGARTQEGSCPNYNSGMGDRGTDLISQLSPQDILAHYAKQMADSGWTAGPSSAFGFWTRTDTSGMVYEYQISVQTYANMPMCRKVIGDLNGRTPR